MGKKEIQIYNSMTKEKEVFKEKEEGKVGMYVCGVTAYDFSHIGHARAYVAFDLLYRYLQYLGYEVKYVRNFTDVDDKIIKRANELGEDPLALSNRFCEEFIADMNDLQCLPPTHQPRVSERMEEIKKMIAQIIEKGCGYAAEGDVYFSVDKFPNYGQLSGRKLDDNRAGERVAVSSKKRNPADFALWKAAKPDEPHWDSPWGSGRPGWHIECSAMSYHDLGCSFDIHGGGMDLIFPHHENELAQSCAAHPETNISYWVHNGFVNINHEKMSKSIGNFFTIREVTKIYHPLALRHFLMSAHYRSPVNYSLEQLDNGSGAVYYMYQALKDCEDALISFQQANQEGAESNGKSVPIISEAKECINKLSRDFETRLSDDLHTPYILNSSLMDTFKLMNKYMENLKKKKQQKKVRLSTIQSLTDMQKEVKKVMSVLGLLSSLTCAEVLQQLKEKALIRAKLTEEDVSRLIAERAQARDNKDFNRSDQIRDDLRAKGINLMDDGKETTWQPCVPVIQEQQEPAVPDQKEPMVPDQEGK